VKENAVNSVIIQIITSRQIGENMPNTHLSVALVICFGIRIEPLHYTAPVKLPIFSRQEKSLVHSLGSRAAVLSMRLVGLICLFSLQRGAHIAHTACTYNDPYEWSLVEGTSRDSFTDRQHLRSK
jgi:hypothetical protein